MIAYSYSEQPYVDGSNRVMIKSEKNEIAFMENLYLALNKVTTNNIM